MRPLPTAAVFSRADVRACGWTDSALTRAARSGRLTRLRHDQFAIPAGRELPAVDHRLLAIGATRSCSGSVISVRSAVLMHGLPLLAAPPRKPDLTVPPGGTGDHSGALLHRATLRPEDVVLIDGVPVTSVARTLVDLARTLPLSAAVVTADAALCPRASGGSLKRPTATPLEIAEVVAACGGWPGIRRARRALKLVDGRAESPLESISRLAIARLDIPTPELQALILSETGVPIGRTDFYFDDVGAAGEADGRMKYTDSKVVIAEKDRQEALENPGVAVTRWGWEVARRPLVLQARLADARERGRRRDASGFPRRWSVEPMAPITIPL